MCTNELSIFQDTLPLNEKMRLCFQPQSVLQHYLLLTVFNFLFISMLIFFNVVISINIYPFCNYNLSKIKLNYTSYRQFVQQLILVTNHSLKYTKLKRSILIVAISFTLPVSLSLLFHFYISYPSIC